MGIGTMFGDFAGAAGDILGGEAKKMGLDIEAQGTRITAEGTRLKAQGDRVEAENYDEASALALQNKRFTEESTAVKEVQTQRQIFLGLGATRADVGASGFAMSGSGLDILRMGAQEGALTKQVIGEQGLITEAGYQEQSDAYNNLAKYARYSAGVEDNIAGEQDDLASKQEDLGSFAQTAGEITGGLKAIAGVASLFSL